MGFMALLHKRNLLALRTRRLLARFQLKSGNHIDVEVVIPSATSASHSDFRYVTYIPYLHYASGKKKALGSGLQGRPTLDGLATLQHRFEKNIIKPQRDRFVEAL